MKLGLIAGNGRFPFLVLDAARALGHEVTVVAVKEEAFAELEAAAAAPPAAALHWISLGQLGACLKILKDRRRDRRPSWPGRSSTRRFSAASCRT